jgi:hypothetical protein
MEKWLKAQRRNGAMAKRRDGFIKNDPAPLQFISFVITFVIIT